MTSSRDSKDDKQVGLPAEDSVAVPTIVGARPPGKAQRSSGFPLGIEVLLKKASVDEEFRKALLEKRSAVAKDIGLDLSRSEAAALDAVPRSQMEQIIERTTIPDEYRRVFLGTIAASMLALLGIPPADAAGRRRLEVAWEFSMGGCTVQFREPHKFRIPENAPSIWLTVGFVDTDSSSMTVMVRYECPFEKGEVKIYFRRDDNTEGSAITVDPQPYQVSKGKGEVAFFAKGHEGETQWLLVSMRDTTEPCSEEPWEFLDWRDFRKSDREYIVRGCALCKVIPLVKNWSKTSEE